MILETIEAVADPNVVGAITKLIPDAVSTASVIIVVVLFLRRQRESQIDFQKQMSDVSSSTVAALDRMGVRFDDLSDKVAGLHSKLDS